MIWNEPYLETCCRSALHRLFIVGSRGRPDGLKDGPCLKRLQSMGFSVQGEDERFRMTAAGAERHAEEILKRKRAA